MPEAIVNGIRRQLPPERPRDTPPFNFHFRLPTAGMFLTCYAAVWLIGGVIIFRSTERLPFLTVSAWNMLFVFINLFGTVIAAASGWVPWRDADDH
ncbi:MAG: hypothetical protein JWP25_3607 [Bradyrhizobium sp.]|nr:hypothetical protein [Bradyrhizobium sp.]